VTDYSPSLDELRAFVDADIDAFLLERTETLGEAQPLIEEIRRVVGLGGKRLRPAFCYWGYRAAGGVHRTGIVRIGTALELLHTFALVHDDIMDEAETRRGEPSTHVVHDAHFALLVGDLALVLADAAFDSVDLPDTACAAGFDVYTRMKQEVIAGQFLDYEVARTGAISEATARRIAMLKSGLYSVVEPLTIGATLGEAGSSTIETLRRFGAPLGEAFQLKDDLLGLFGRVDEVGKPVGSDVREGKRNLLYVWTRERLRGEERRDFESRWGAADLTESEITTLTKIVDASGARRDVETLLTQLAERSRAALSALDAGDEVEAALSDLAEAAIDRLA